MNEKIKITLVAAAAFGMGAASMAAFVAGATASVLKELNNSAPKKNYRYSRASQKADLKSV